jgi:Mrp family chromosome partitioning ATPase
MAQAEQSKFKSTVVDLSFARAPEPVVPAPEAAPRSAIVEVNGSVVRRGDEVQQGPLAVRTGSSHAMVAEALTLDGEPDERLVLLNGAASGQARAYRLLRHRLRALGDPRVITVTSAEAGAGKTTCAVNLALALADETLARVLLIEANVERPAFAGLFGFAPGDSFVNRLVQSRDATPPYPIAGLVGTRLHVAALSAAAPPGARLDRSLFDLVIADLRRGYHHVVIDAASVLESADANVCAECADGTILVARAGKSRKSALQRAIKELSPSKVLGCVLLDA